LILKIRNEVTVGALTLIGIVTLILGYNYLRGNDVFTRTQKIKINFPNTTGLYTANSIVINGLEVGRVSEINLASDPAHQVIVTVNLPHDLFIPDDSKFQIMSVDLLGKKAITITKGTSTKPLSTDKIYMGLSSVDMIAELTQQIVPLKDKAETLMGTLDTMMKDVHIALGKGENSNLNVAMKEVTSALKSANKLLANVSTLMSAEKGNIQSLIKNADGVMLNANTLTKKLADNSQKIENILADIEKFSGNISELELKETIESAKKTLTEISNLLASVNEGQGTLGKIVKDESLYTSIDSTINTLNSLLKDVQANPKRYVSLSLIERKDKKK
jgi:phospholipid/cholesterol/gamma-HCH transport system substrate-binding protein